VEGMTAADIQQRTEPKLLIADNLKTIAID
jgi:hypothetical protein